MRASPRREFLGHLFSYMHFHIAGTEFSRIPVSATFLRSVVVLLVGVPKSAARAMVAAGMAMAIKRTMSLAERSVINGIGAKTTRGVAGETDGDIVRPEITRFIVTPFTPLHIAVKGVELLAFGMYIWGRLPREADANSSPPCGAVGAANVATETVGYQHWVKTRRSLALTSPGPPGLGRAWNPVAVTPRRKMARRSPALTPRRPQWPARA